MSAKVEPILTIADLDIMPEDGNRYELIQGELLVSRSPNLIHQSVSGKLHFLIASFLARNPVGKVWATPGVMLSNIDGVIPDIVFVSNDRLAQIAAGDQITGAPDVVIEIVSPGASNERRDRIAKRQLYGKYGVKQYLVADYQNRTVEVYVLKGKLLRLAATLADGDELTCAALPGFKCKVKDIFDV